MSNCIQRQLSPSSSRIYHVSVSIDGYLLLVAGFIMSMCPWTVISCWQQEISVHTLSKHNTLNLLTKLLVKSVNT